MKKIIIFLILILGITFSGFTQTTASIIIRGTVPANISLTIIEEQVEFDLTQNVNNILVATVNERSNVRNGYTVSLNSANDFKFVGGAGDDELSYLLRYNGVELDLSINDLIITDENDRTGQGNNGIDKNLEISFSGEDYNFYEGLYEDTLTFTITAK